MSLTSKTRQQLKAKAHQLKPVVMIGNQGLTEAVHKEIARGLHDHELIKIRIGGENRDERRACYEEICEHHAAEPVQLIGAIAVIYKKADPE